MALTDMEMMAVAVLKGDMGAAAALADEVVGRLRDGTYIPPIRKGHIEDVDNLRFFVFMKDLQVDEEVDMESIRNSLLQWVNGGEDLNALVLQGVDRIEVYEIRPKSQGA
jgi:hypothetical protein